MLDTGDAFFAPERLVSQVAAGNRQFLVQPMVVAARDDQPRDDDHGRAVDLRVRHRADGDTMQLLHVVLRPDLRAQQAQTHLHQAMVQMDEHDVVTATGDGVIECDGPYPLGVRVAQPLQASRPGAGQRGHPKDAARWCAIEFGGFQRRAARQREAGLHGHRDVVGREVEVLLGGEQTLVQLGDALFQLAFGANEVLGPGDPRFGESGIQVF